MEADKIDNFFLKNALYLRFLEDNGIDAKEYIKNLKECREKGLRCFRIRDPTIWPALI